MLFWILSACQPGYVKLDPIVDDNQEDSVVVETEEDWSAEPSNEETTDVPEDSAGEPSDETDQTDETSEPSDEVIGEPSDEIDPETEPSSEPSDETTEEEEEDTTTDPFEDSDNDGLTDVVEDNLGTDSENPDSDGDGLSDGEEIYYGTDPLNEDSDGDGASDGDETADGTDPLDDNGNGSNDTGAWDWGEPSVDASLLAGTYNATFSFTNSLTSYVLCQSNITVNLQPDGTLTINEPCVTPNGSVLDIEQNFQVYNVVDYSGHYGYGSTYVYGYLQGDVTVTVPSGATFTSSGQHYSSGTVTDYNNTRSISLYWSVEIMTPSGLKTYQGTVNSH